MRSKKAIPIASEGMPFVIGFTAAGAIMSIPHPVTRAVGFIFIVLAIFSCFFFRDPDRLAPNEALNDVTFILSPADGRVMEVAEESMPHWNAPAKVIRIFLSVFDVHVQRAPIAGRINKIEYRKGKFLDARNPRAHAENEQNLIIMENARMKVGVKQIAGLIARRIVCKVKPDQTLALGQRLGLIRFGSQVNLYLPPGTDVCVQKGEYVTGGLSVVAFLKKTEPKSHPVSGGGA
jgi:phosphatidylserine decarboxylase